MVVDFSFPTPRSLTPAGKKVVLRRPRQVLSVKQRGEGGGETKIHNHGNINVKTSAYLLNLSNGFDRKYKYVSTDRYYMGASFPGACTEYLKQNAFPTVCSLGL